MNSTWGHLRSYSTNEFFAHKIWWNGDTAVGLVPMCFSCRDTSTDIQHDLSGSPHDLMWPWPEVKFWHELFWVNMHTDFDASCQDEQDNIQIIPLAFFVQKLFVKYNFVRFFLASMALPIKDRSILMPHQQKNSSRATDCFCLQSPTYRFPQNYSYPSCFFIYLVFVLKWKCSTKFLYDLWVANCSLNYKRQA